MKEKDLYFSFEFVDKPKISKDINKLDSKKACQEHEIPVKSIKSNKDLFFQFIYHNLNNSLFSSNFPSNLPDIENYRPISILPTLSKIYERCMCDHMYDQILSKCQCTTNGYIQSFRLHGLLIAKLAAYGSDSHSLSFIFSYLNERKQIIKIHNSYSPYGHIACAVLQGSILGSLLFNINLCDMIFEKCECDIASYADDNTPHTYDSDLCTILSKLKNCTDSLFTRFKENQMKLNGDKCHLLVTIKKSVSINASGSNVKNKKEQKLLGIKFDASLSFEGHITNLCKEASQKLQALAGIVNYMDLP